MVEYATVKNKRVDETSNLVKGLVISTYFTWVDITSVFTKFPPFNEGGNHIFYRVYGSKQISRL